ncbi:N-6 DNA methylase [Pusillimonas noertemannii]|uniref:Helicase-like protein n=1 Tax=Pusillimonas noertemannii TaxID=305977 RepID=A0A2U1CMC9_9BURK|nr:N-6 DNA methylase [Pusillimonas noertemannii]NYT68807.1 N-6 DNA methylase [Pusillimonas noertemannii]PVY62169.1 helicase-like protein [Pusillimonas noertemannii]TFL10843.1 hypothetical protein CSC72_10045 [Pusillimonas noertemannii]
MTQHAGDLTAEEVMQEPPAIGEIIQAATLALSGVALDKVSGMPSIETLRLAGELSGLLRSMGQLGDEPSDLMEKLKLAVRMREIVQKLNGATAAPLEHGQPSEPVTAQEEPPAIVNEPDAPPATLFEFNPDIKASQRKRANRDAMDLLSQIEMGAIAEVTDEHRRILAQYSGNGGGMTGADGKVGSQYEYYTPKPLAVGVWSLLAEMGFEGGKVLDPSAGTGIFGATAPDGAVIDAVELDQTSGRINQLINAKNNVTISAFESVAANTPDEIYDAVVTNVPFGDVAARGKERFKDERYQHESLEGYFILRSLEKLRPRGLAAFICSKGFVSNRGAKESKLRFAASLKAEFMGAYRLPNKMFEAGGADVVTDVLVFRKFDHDTIDKIAELQQQNPDALRSANVLWEPFLEGKYFQDEGRRFILGETAIGTGRWGEVERVVNDDSIGNISRLLRRFGESRINWEALGAAETRAITYTNGDTVTSAGVTYQYRDGTFVAVKAPEGDAAQADTLLRVSTALDALGSRTGWAESSALVDGLAARSDYDSIPPWLNSAVRAIRSQFPEAERDQAYSVIRTALALQEALQSHSSEEPFAYAESYPGLTADIKVAARAARKLPKSLPSNIKDALKLLSPGVVYTVRSDEFTPRWTGTAPAQVEATPLTPTQQYERAKYEQADENGFIPLAVLRETMGADFDPFVSDDWCVSADGQGAMSADDYYAGNYAEFLARTNAEILAVEDEALRAKLVAQRQAAEGRLVKTDVGELSFNLSSPYIEIARKVEFLRKYVDPGFSLLVGGADGPEVRFDQTQSKLARNSEQLRNMRRFADYIKNGTLSTRTTQAEKEDDPEVERSRVERLRELISSSNQQFDAWARANPAIQAELNSRFADPENLYFRQPDDESPLEIPGLNPAFQPHGYQNAAIRQYARRMSGILGFDVGLGKTFTALTAVQHIHAIGVKRKTFFVVPNATLTNWRKETMACYSDTSDCLFVGMDVAEDGTATVNSSNYVRDLNAILNNEHRKIYMTLEAFSMIPLREETRESYAQYLTTVDESFDASSITSKSESVKTEGKLEKAVQGAGKGSAAVPFFEDMGVDSIVIDEAHSYKNSKTTTDFQGAKYLSAPTVSNRGMDAQIKTWYIRGQSKLNDGVLALTATPITNSPLEIYSMLTLAVGEAEVNRRMGGVRGADAFMEAFCDISEETTTSLAGVERMNRVFRGLNNTALLRNVLGEVATIRSAVEVGLKVPGIDPVPVPVSLSEPPIMAELRRLQAVYSAASAMQREKDVLPEEEAAVHAEMERTGETLELLAHPFNFINKVTKLIADPELADQSTVFLITDATKAKKAVEQFNKRAVREERSRRTPLLKDENIVKRVIKKSGDNDYEVLTVKVAAQIDDDRIVIDTETYSTQLEFIKIADKLGLSLDATIPPKIAAFLENFQREQATPSAGGAAKQLVFCDMLGLHNKLKLLLTTRAGVSASAISIINGEAVRDPADMQDIQDGFNANGEDNRYRVIIANKKAEVGINLQKGTQAIHHLTVGWTPDSIHQRNGRGARQGNVVDAVRAYFYDAIGTFDQYKRQIVSKKSDWIGELMSGTGNKVQVSAGMSRQDIEMLAEAAGSEEGMRRVQERIATREAEERRRAAQEALASNVQNMIAQRAIVDRYPNVGSFLAERVADAAETYLLVTKAEARLAAAEKAEDEGRISRAQVALNKAKAAYEKLAEPIRASIRIDGSGSYDTLEKALSQSSWMLRTRGSYEVKGIDREQVISSVSNVANGNRYYGLKFEVVEDGPVSQDWEIEISTAEQLAKQSEEKAAKLCGPAGVKDDRIEQVKGGQARVVRGQIVGAGDFVLDRLDNLWIMESSDKAYRLDVEGGRKYTANADILLTGNIVAKEHADYRACVARAAKEDDALIARMGGALTSGAQGYFSFNTDVRDALQARPKMKAEARTIRFAEPMFPHLYRGETQGDPLLDRITTEQRGIVEIQDNYAIFEADAVESDGGYVGSPQLASDLVAYAIRHGVQVSYVAASEILGVRDSSKHIANALDRVIGAPSAEAFNAALEAVDTVEAIDALAEDFLARHYKAMQIGPNEAWFTLAPWQFSAMMRRREAQLTPPEPEVVPEPQEPAAQPSGGDPNELVAIIGDTKAFKDTIKSVALSMGIKAIFRGKYPNRSLPSAPQNSWVVPRKVYDRLLDTHADGVRRNSITIA